MVFKKDLITFLKKYEIYTVNNVHVGSLLQPINFAS